MYVTYNHMFHSAERMFLWSLWKRSKKNKGIVTQLLHKTHYIDIPAFNFSSLRIFLLPRMHLILFKIIDQCYKGFTTWFLLYNM